MPKCLALRLLLALGSVPVVLSASGSTEEARPRFERVAWDAGLRDPAAAVYQDAGDGGGNAAAWLAIGDAAGVVRVNTGLERPSAERVLRRGPVRDLALAPEGELWVATAEGLFRLSALDADPPRVDEVRLGAGGSARDVRRVAAVPGLVAAATASGAFLARDGGSFVRVTAARHRAAESLALWPGLDLALVLDGRAERVPEGSDALELLRVAPATARVLDASIRRADGEVALQLLTSRALWRASLEESALGAWRRIAWVAPPGAALRRVFHVARRDWVTSDRGLLLAASGEASAPRLLRVLEIGSLGEIVAVVGGGETVFAIGARGVGRLAPPAAAPHVLGAPSPAAAPRSLGVPSPAAAPRSLGVPSPVAAPRVLGVPSPVAAPRSLGAPSPAAGDPEIGAVHRAVLRHLDLGPERMRRLWRGASRRGWLPTLELRGRYGGGRDQGNDYDETFTSGERRLFHDRDWGRARDFDVSAVLRFDLGAIAYEPESIDVSREAREVIELRDDVLDEVNQLYFERRRSLRQAADPALPPAEATRLRERAEELAAGLDAWSGGWFGRARRPSSPSGPTENRP